MWVQSQCEVRLVRLMPPEAFWPRPKVTSAIVQIRLDPHRREQNRRSGFFSRVCANAFLAPPQIAAGRAIGQLAGAGQ